MKNPWKKGLSISMLWASLSLVAFCGQTSEPGLMKVAEPLYVVRGLSSNSAFLANGGFERLAVIRPQIAFSRKMTVHQGDLLFNNDWVPRLDADVGCSVDNWLKIYDRVAAVDVQVIIPGHGEVTDKAGFLKTSRLKADYLSDLKAEVARFVQQGASLQEIRSKLKLPKYQTMEIAELLLPYNIEGAYREIVCEPLRSDQVAGGLILLTGIYVVNKT